MFKISFKKLSLFKTWFKKYWWIFPAGLVVLAIFWWLIDYGIRYSAKGLIYENVAAAPSKPVAMVLGAQVIGNKVMSGVFADRVETARLLYKAGKVQKILVSGDDSQPNYDEVDIAKDYLLANGVPAEAIYLDHAGLDTYDSMYRAIHIFNIQSMLIVTQDFHLPRAIYLARNLGLDVAGVSADLHKYVTIDKMVARERLARVKAFLDILFSAQPTYLGPPVDINGSSNATTTPLGEVNPK
jgi:SanA protein